MCSIYSAYMGRISEHNDNTILLMILTDHFVKEPYLMELVRLAAEKGNQLGLDGIAIQNVRFHHPGGDDPLCLKTYLIADGKKKGV